MQWLAGTVAWVAMLIAIACAQGRQPPYFLEEHDWYATGTWLRGDTHAHTRASDGQYEIGELAAKARAHGCDVLAVTDHSHQESKAGTPEYMAGILAARSSQPDLLIVPGLEWNVPPRGGDEHASVLFPDSPQTGAMLAEFKRRFDDFDRTDLEQRPTVEAALDWLAEASLDLPVRPVVVYNHPSRKDQTSLSNAEDMTRWRAINSLVIGFEGGPGHQGKEPLGSYSGAVATIDRWDPVVAHPGDAWDTVLARGIDVHGALASADFHTDNPNDLNDYPPCQFGETRYFVPERSVAGVLRAMRAGTFFGAHGHIVTALDLTALIDGMPRPVGVGERALVAAGTTASVVLSLDIPGLDWQQQPNHVDVAEFFVTTPGGTQVHTQPISGIGEQVVAQRVVVDAPGVVVRARVRRVVDDGPDLMAYTNAIRLVTP